MLVQFSCCRGAPHCLELEVAAACLVTAYAANRPQLVGAGMNMNERHLTHLFVRCSFIHRHCEIGEYILQKFYVFTDYIAHLS